MGDRIAAHVHDLLQKRKQAIGLHALRSLVMSTPVDTGEARGGWVAGVGSAPASPERKDPTGQTAISEGTAAIMGAKPEESIVISNSVPHIIPLNDGHSSQAPHGMVEVMKAELRTIGIQ